MKKCALWNIVDFADISIIAMIIITKDGANVFPSQL